MAPARTFAGMVAQCLSDRRRVDLYTVVGSDEPHRYPVGARVVCPEGVTPQAFGTGDSESRKVRAQIPMTDPAGGPGMRSVEVEPGVKLEVHAERLLPPLQCVVVGAGHVGSALVRIGMATGWHMVVADDRGDYADRELFDAGVRVICTPFEALWQSVKVDAATAVVLVTRGHRHDESVLNSLVGQPAFYVGMIGSRRRVMRVLDQLRSDRVPEEWLKKLYAPIGLPVGADTPGEIALAIAAEITSVWRRRGDWAHEEKERYYKSR